MLKHIACAVAFTVSACAAQPAAAAFTRITDQPCELVRQLYGNLAEAAKHPGWRVRHFTGAKAAALAAVTSVDLPEWWAVEQPEGVVVFADDPGACVAKRRSMDTLEWLALIAAAGIDAKGE